MYLCLCKFLETNVKNFLDQTEEYIKVSSIRPQESHKRMNY